MQIQEVVTAARSPWQNAYVERFIGSIRRECLDHVIVLSAAGAAPDEELKSNYSKTAPSLHRESILEKDVLVRVRNSPWASVATRRSGATRCSYMVRLLQEAKPRDLGSYLAAVDGWVIVGSALV